jgi:predicted ribosomally synthesized peptide with nif11-like leader
MAIHEAKEFLDEVDASPDLQAKLRVSYDQFIDTAQQHGYSFTRKELSDELRRRWGMTDPPPYGEDPDTCFCVP